MVNIHRETIFEGQPIPLDGETNRRQGDLGASFAGGGGRGDHTVRTAMGQWNWPLEHGLCRWGEISHFSCFKVSELRRFFYELVRIQETIVKPTWLPQTIRFPIGFRPNRWFWPQIRRFRQAIAAHAGGLSFNWVDATSTYVRCHEKWDAMR